MKYVKIELEVSLPDDFSESEIDTKIADTIATLGGEVLNSENFTSLDKEYSEMQYND